MRLEETESTGVPPALGGSIGRIGLLEECNELCDGVLLLGASSRAGGSSGGSSGRAAGNSGVFSDRGGLSGSRGLSSGRAGRSGSHGRRGRGGAGGRLGSSRGSGSGSWGVLDGAEGKELGSSLSSTLDQSGARNGVAVKRSVDAEAKTRASLAVGVGEGDGVGWLESTASRDGKLVARNVVLSTTSRASSVESDSLSTEEVITRGEVLGDGEAKLATAVVEVLGTPQVVVTLGGARCLSPGVLVHLEEVLRTSSGGSILDGGHVGKHGAPVSTTDTLLSRGTGIVLVHLDGDLVSSSKLAVSFRIGRVHVALQRGAAVVLNGAVGRDLPDTLAAEVLTVLPEVLPCGVGVGSGSEASDNSSGLHV